MFFRRLPCLRCPPTGVDVYEVRSFNSFFWAPQHVCLINESLIAAVSKNEVKLSDKLRKIQADQAVLQARRLRDERKIAEAVSLVHQIVMAEPGHVGALRLLGALAMQTGATEIAIDSFARALARSPHTPEILVEYGDALVAGKRPDEALSAFKRALKIRPRDAAIFHGLGLAHLDMGNRADALKSFRKVLSIAPDSQFAANLVTSLSGDAGTPDPAYVADLFDGYADMFDEHLTGALAYRVPELIAELLVDRTTLGEVLDLGCGTGLVALAIKDKCGPIDGIDISSAMIRKARDRGIYRHLRAGDTVQVLTSDAEMAGPYNLVTAGDVFVYVGPLETTFAAVASVLAPAGLFAFTVESASGDEVLLRSTARFSHPASYIHALAEKYGFTILTQRDTPLRQERNEPIPGTLYLLTSKASASLGQVNVN